VAHSLVWLTRLSSTLSLIPAEFCVSEVVNIRWCFFSLRGERVVVDGI
jgi:hypothetical protein